MNDQVHRSPRLLSIGDIQTRIGLLFHIVILDVRHYTDDLKYPLLIIADLQPFADWFAVRKETSRKSLIDQYNGRGSIVILLGEQPAFAERSADRVEVT